MRSTRSHRRASLAWLLPPLRVWWLVAGWLLLVAKSPAAAQVHYCGDNVTSPTDVLATLVTWTSDGPCRGTLPADFPTRSATDQRNYLDRLMTANAGTAAPPQRRRCSKPVAACAGLTPGAYVEASIQPINDAHKVRPLALPATGVLIGRVVNVRRVGGADFDTLTGAGRYDGAEIYLILHNELINGRGNVSRRHLLDSVYSARIEFATYVPTTAGGWTLRPNVDPATFGLCEVMHGPWSVAAADFWSCDHVHDHLRCLMRNPDSVTSATTLYRALREQPSKDCNILPRNRQRDTLDSRANSLKQNSAFQLAAFTPADVRRSPFDATSGVRRTRFFQSSFDDPGWSTCPLGCCAVYR